jgi:cytidine deaminase
MKLTPAQKALVDVAVACRENAYTPYSNFAVGAALLTDDGEVIVGCNVENASYGATNCAERTAIFSAIAAGHRKFAALAVVADRPDPVTPCGICRQVLVEFNRDMVVICANTGGDAFVTTAGHLLPASFNLETPQK